MKYKNFTAFASLIATAILSATSIFASQMTPMPGNIKDIHNTQTTKNTISQESINTGATEFNKIIDEFKEYLNTVTPEVRNEVITYRKAILAINKQKRELYKKLSQEAQEYLNEEREYKRRLPLKQRDVINMQKPGASYKKDTE